MMKVWAVIVTYNPVFGKIKECVERLAESNILPIIVDNTENTCLWLDSFSDKCKLIKLHSNRGIAAAQNIGVEYAMKNGGGIIAFFDQDSVIDSLLINNLKKSFEDDKMQVIAPVSINGKTGEEYPSQVIGKFGLPVDIFANGMKSKVKVDIVISSGMFVRSEVFNEVGLFDSSLFIDFVDIEWCLRCYKLGIEIFVDPKAVMKHYIGEKSISIGPLLVNVHSPYRTYYKVRNPFLLIQKKMWPLFVGRQISSAVIKNFILIFGKQGTVYLRYYLLGMMDGILQKGGKYESIHKR